MATSTGLAKSPTGITGLDTITHGGLPKGRTTLVEGKAGAGKTVLALQTLVNGARDYGEPGIFVAFEESTERICVNASSFGWDIPSLDEKDLFLLDAQPSADLVQSGGFDLGGMLAALDAKVTAMGAQRIAFDALDIVLGLLEDRNAVRREVYRLHDWLLSRGLTAIITHKAGWRGPESRTTRFDFMQFMVDCTLLLEHEIVKGISQRKLCVVKYRGSSFDANEAATVIGRNGLEVAAFGPESSAYPEASDERVSSGIERLDTMLGGGYHRGASILLTGAPGTAKTTLCGTFVEAACLRGESILFVSFDSPSGEVIRNLKSVGIDLRPFIEQGLLHMRSTRTTVGSADIHLLRVKSDAEACQARCVVIDPLSALSKAAMSYRTQSVVERLVEWSKAHGITLMSSSLLDGDHPDSEGTSMQISTLADTWIHLNYLVRGGERNRGLTIVKSRGTGHSNQVRELIISDEGLTLADVFSAGGEVFMGTLRADKERVDRLERQTAESESRRQKVKLDSEVLEFEARLANLQRELSLKKAEQSALASEEASESSERTAATEEIRTLRGADADTPTGTIGTNE